MRLFLDDIRSIKQVFNYKKDIRYLQEDWDIVRSYEEFVYYIKNNEIPEKEFLKNIL